MSTSSPEEAKNRTVEIAGYAIISDDNKIAGPDGLLPPSMRNEKDWEYYQRALARSDLIVFGHRSHELEPNTRGDQRIVISRGADGLEQRCGRMVVEPRTYKMGGGRETAAAGRRRRGRARRQGRVRSLPGDRL